MALAANPLRQERGQTGGWPPSRDFHHAGTGGCPDKRHDAEVIQVLPC
jgi:hypothetical protein